MFGRGRIDAHAADRIGGDRAGGWCVVRTGRMFHDIPLETGTR
jgi:hypothetical protein